MGGLAAFHEDEEEFDRPSDCFTLQALDSTKNELIKNASTKSVILAPFNSTKTHFSEDDDFEESLAEKYPKGEKVIFHARVREIDRQYERNNN
jgi:hypothetical protein